VFFTIQRSVSVVPEWSATPRESVYNESFDFEENQMIRLIAGGCL
jgi:hypothetical protein